MGGNPRPAAECCAPFLHTTESDSRCCTTSMGQSKDSASDSTRTTAAGLAPGRYFRLLLIGYFEGLDAERAIAWRNRGFVCPARVLGLVLPDAPPDHPPCPVSHSAAQTPFRRASNARTWPLGPALDSSRALSSRPPGTRGASMSTQRLPGVPSRSCRTSGGRHRLLPSSRRERARWRAAPRYSLAGSPRLSALKPRDRSMR